MMRVALACFLAKTSMNGASLVLEAYNDDHALHDSYIAIKVAHLWFRENTVKK